MIALPFFVIACSPGACSQSNGRALPPIDASLRNTRYRCEAGFARVKQIEARMGCILGAMMNADSQREAVAENGSPLVDWACSPRPESTVP